MTAVPIAQSLRIRWVGIPARRWAGLAAHYGFGVANTIGAGAITDITFENPRVGRPIKSKTANELESQRNQGRVEALRISTTVIPFM
jgi:hypothetical protein